jgi:hypothetical protein
MGLDKFTNFLCKSLNNNSYEELYINNNIRKIVSTHIIFDINFLIYQELLEIENEINDIIKIILCCSFNIDKIDIIKDILKKKFSEIYWNDYKKSNELIELIDYDNEDYIIKKFLTDLNTNIHENILLIEIIIYNKINNTIINNINNFHIIELIKNISIFFDGIPSISKVIEQRRRRIKNYLETNNRKNLFKLLFENLNNNNNINITDELYFDYLKWLNEYKFIIDKTLGPASNFITNCEKYIYNNINNLYPNINIYIDKSINNGEADFKIFKYINNEICDYSIHTIDSDLIHLMLIQLVYYNLINKDININILKYNSTINKYNLIQLFDGNLIIKNILNLYNNINNIKTNNYKIIWDLCLIFLSFGNDHLPASLEIGAELGFEFFIKTHYQALNKNTIISIEPETLKITMDLQNFSLYLSKINETKKNNITKIILQRYFKINIQLINLLVYKLNLDFNEILEYLKQYIIYKSKLLSEEEFDNLDEDDLRKIYYNEIFDNIIFDEEIDNILNNNLDYLESEYNGLILYNKPYNIINNSYKDLYNYIIDLSIITLSKEQPLFYNYIDIKEYIKELNIIDNINVEEYLKNLYYQTLILFGSMENFHSDNITFYKEYYVPSLTNIINYISLIDKNIQDKWNNELNNNNINKNEYLNSLNHHILISPFSNIKNLNNINLENIENLCINDINNFQYRNIDIKEYFNCW